MPFSPCSRANQLRAQVQELIEDDRRCVLTPLGVAEVLDHLVRLANAEEDEAVLDLAQLGLATPTAVEAALALERDCSALATITARTEP